jgi:hypothetical protein
MRLIDPEIQMKIDKLRDEKEILLQKYVYHENNNNITVVDGLELLLSDIDAQINALEQVKYI